MSEFLVWLTASSRKRVLLDDLKRKFYSLYPDVQNSPARGARLLDALRALEAQGHVALPAASSWERAASPPLPKWVSLVRSVEAQPAENFARVPWVPELGFWTELKAAQLPTAKAVNDFLLRRRGAFRLVPVKERSLEIFGDEKKMDAMSDRGFLFGRRLHVSALGAFHVEHPLPYRQADAPGMPVLVLENHNSFWSFGEWNIEAKRYAAVVYGGGEALRRSGAALRQVLHEVKGEGADYLGDLDPKGVRIPLDFNLDEANEPKVRPALSWYRWLLAQGHQREKAECSLAPSASAAGWLGNELGAELAALWSAGKWIPQEALGFEQLMALATPPGSV